eukprot:TRINITY_DN12252_c0_g1_i1.p1 TRINITY_DN12252_c0_g1~~TRINITY_DN12252_c0_g1_i1.p1  ORF type:complete len:554 (+),score=140.23 TRINITY_DN12252_c0_g1_i1:114-1775(+)
MSLFDFGGVPQNPLTMAIDKATSEGHPSEDLGLHLEICDQINHSQSGPKDAAKCLKKKLAPKNGTSVVFKALVVLETAVKNCGKRFHLQVTTKDFTGVYVKILNHREQAEVVRSKLLGLIQAMGESFRSDPAMSAVVNLYQDMRLRNVEFPAQNLDEMAPINTPAVNEQVIAQQQQEQQQQQRQRSIPSASSAPQSDEEFARQLSQQLNADQNGGGVPPQGPPSSSDDGFIMRTQPLQLPEGESIEATPEQQEKIRKDLEVVSNNATMLTDMLQALEEGQTVRGSDIIVDLHTACQQMQQRVMILVSQLRNEDLLAELLLASDLLSTALQFYDDCVERDARNAPPGTTFPAEAQPQPPQAQNGLLVDLSDTPTAQPTGVSSNDPFANPIVSPHDPFATPSSQDPFAPSPNDPFSPAASGIDSSLGGLNLGPAPGSSSTDPLPAAAQRYSAPASNGHDSTSDEGEYISVAPATVNTGANRPPVARLTSTSHMEEPVEMASSSLLSKINRPAEGNLIDLGDSEPPTPIASNMPVSVLSEADRERMENQHDDLFEL